MLLADALASIRRLEDDGLAFEILVGDNGNSEATARVIAEFGADRIPVTLRGASAARNGAMRKATGDFIAFLDDDDVWLPGHLKSHIALMQADPTVGAVLGQVCNASADLSTTSDPWPTELAPRPRLFRQMLGFYPQIGATIIRATTLPAVGYFDESLASDEDWDWHLRLATATTVGFVATPCVLFRQRPLTGGDLEWRRMKYNRKVLWMNVRRQPHLGVALGALRAVAKHRGGYAHQFAREAGAEYARRSRSGARVNILRSLIASPPHAIVALYQHAATRRALAAFVPTRNSKGAH